MRGARAVGWCSVLVVLGSPRSGAAEGPLRTDEVRVEDARLGDAGGAAAPEPSAFVTVIDAREASVGAATLPEVLARAAAVQVRS